ncbi:hypothetical protein [Agrobacterium fabrum]|uniref:hypothetical protein n=1 Tax=Agrobacterium fabrum TaxID=1176649 RepID=UPI0013CEC73B|nr:hypothetical protein [Agrobacterium fabrum]NSZ15000.1 hypothetical protein [Agrobacterium fabrum]
MSEKLSVKSSASGDGTVPFTGAVLAKRQVRLVCPESVEKIFVFGGAGTRRPHHRLTRLNKLVQLQGMSKPHYEQHQHVGPMSPMLDLNACNNCLSRDNP